MNDIVDRLRSSSHDIACERVYPSDSCGCNRRSMKVAADEIERLMAELAFSTRRALHMRALLAEWAEADSANDYKAEIENLRQDVQFWTDEAQKFKESSRHNYAACARLRALVAEWAEADSANDFMANDTAAIRYARAMEALREEADR